MRGAQFSATLSDEKRCEQGSLHVCPWSGWVCSAVSNAAGATRVEEIICEALRSQQSVAQLV